MLEIVGLLLLAIVIVMGLGFLADHLTDLDGFFSKPLVQKKNPSLKNEKASSIYSATKKSLELNMMQIDSLKQMEEVAQKYKE